MPVLHFQIKSDLIVGGRTHTWKPSGLQACAELDTYGGSTRASCFYLNSWIGDVNQETSIDKVNADGVAVVKINVNAGDVNTLKLEYNFVSETKNGDRLHHHCSSFIPMTDLIAHLDGTKRESCFMKSNFDQNGALMQFTNISTDLVALKNLKLKPSSLLQQEAVNKAIFKMGTNIKSKLATCDISKTNAGAQFVDGFSFLPMQGVLTNYALMGFTFKNLSTPVNLGWTMYNAYKTAEATGIDMRTLHSMSDETLVNTFGTHLVTRPTSCAFTTPYGPDLTFDAVGRVTKDSESIDRSLSAMQLAAQGVTSMYTGAFDNKSSLADCISLLAHADIHNASIIRKGISPAALNDDCENQAMGIILQGQGLVDMVDDIGTPENLARAMAQVAHNNRLFEGFTMEHHTPMAACLHRLGTLLKNDKWSLGFAVVSAKGAAYNSENMDQSQLSGHGTVISRLTDELGTNHFLPCEGTSYITTDTPRPPSLASQMKLGLADNTFKDFNLATVATLFAQNVHELAAISPNSRILGHVLSQYDDPIKDTPFYVSVFYSGLQQGNKTFGCVPLDTSSGAVPMFGAPVLGLSRETSVAIPLQPSLMTESREEAKTLMALVCAQANEVYPPQATPLQVKYLMSHWQPCVPPGSDAMFTDPEKHLRAECTSAFDDPVHTTAAVKVYKHLAAEFNKRQLADPADDKVRMEGYGTFLSAALKLRIPIPPASSPKFVSSTMRNLREAVAHLGMQSIVTQPDKVAHINTQAAIPTAHPFFMCENGQGLVHSHSVKLL